MNLYLSGMKDLTAEVETIKKLSRDVFLLSFKSGYISRNALPGQFVHININSRDLVLRRPFSINRVLGDSVYILFKVRGKGTNILSRKKVGDKIKVLGPLGKGFSLPKAGSEVILLAGGIGIAPLVFLAYRVRETGSGYVLLGGKSRQDIFFEDYFRKLGFKVLISTEDGSLGRKDKVTGLLKTFLAGERADINIYSCGPKPMYKSLKGIIENYRNVQCQVSLEEFMGCGIGVCKGCAVNTLSGIKYVCRDGPVFNLKELEFASR